MSSAIQSSESQLFYPKSGRTLTNRNLKPLVFSGKNNSHLIFDRTDMNLTILPVINRVLAL